MKYLVILAVVVFSTVSLAEESIVTDEVTATPTSEGVEVTESVTEETVAAPSQGKVTGKLEFRPTHDYSSGKYTTENEASIGYDFSDTFGIGYTQYFGINEKAIADDGFAKVKFSDVWTDKANGLSLSLQPRLYAPTKAASRDAGMITAARLYVDLKKEFSDSFSLTFTELPIGYVYSRAANGDAANPAVENRNYLSAEIKLGAGFTLNVPIMFHLTKKRSSVGAKDSGAWTTYLYAWPDISYKLNDSVNLGVAYRTANFVADGATVGSAISDGAAQFIFNASL